MMTGEDQELFLEMLLKLDETHDSIKAASKWCRANAACHEQIVRMWFFAVAKAITPRRRLHLFHLASDILFTAEPTSIQYFSSFLPQLLKAVPLLRGDEIKTDMKKLFKIWRDKKIYNKVVMQQLNMMLHNRNKAADPTIFKYDKDLLFKNLKRVGDLKPACDYLSRGVDFSPSFDNSQALLSTIKERRSCQSLLASVDSHKSRLTLLVTYMEEMAHLLKMSTVTLDIAGNKEQNGIEETKTLILAHTMRENKMKEVLSALEKKFGFTREDYAKPITPASPEQDEGTSSLYSRRVGTVGVPGDPRMANIPVMIPAVAVMPPILPAVPPVPTAPLVITNWKGGPQLPPGEPDDIFTRRNRAGSMTPRRDDMAFTNPAPPPRPGSVTPRREDMAFTNPALLPRAGSMPSRQDNIAFSNPAAPPLPTDDLPFACPRPPLPREPMPSTSARVARDDFPFLSRPNMTPTRESPWGAPRSRRAMTPLLDEPPESPRLREEPWDTPRHSRSRDEHWSLRELQQELPCDSPRPRRLQDEPWDTARPHALDGPRSPRPQTPREEVLNTPMKQCTRDEPWSPRPHAAREEVSHTARRQSARDQPSYSQSHTARGEGFDTPRPHTSTEEPWERGPSREVTPTRDEPWSPVSPLYTGAWGPPLKKPVYMPCYTGFHLESPDKPSMPPPSYKTHRGHDRPAQRPCSWPQTPGNSQIPKPLLPDPPRPIPLLGDRPQPKRPLLPLPTASPIPSLMSMRGDRKNRHQV